MWPFKKIGDKPKCQEKSKPDFERPKPKFESHRYRLTFNYKDGQQKTIDVHIKTHIIEGCYDVKKLSMGGCLWVEDNNNEYYKIDLEDIESMRYDITDDEDVILNINVGDE